MKCLVFRSINSQSPPLYRLIASALNLLNVCLCVYVSLKKSLAEEEPAACQTAMRCLFSRQQEKRLRPWNPVTALHIDKGIEKILYFMYATLHHV